MIVPLVHDGVLPDRRVPVRMRVLIGLRICHQHSPGLHQQGPGLQSGKPDIGLKTSQMMYTIVIIEKVTNKYF